jgi:hypothetical protein
MSDRFFLTREEMAELTGRSQSKAQAAVLNSLGVQYKIRADGRVLVLRAHLEQQFGVKTKKNATGEENFNWDAA